MIPLAESPDVNFGCWPADIPCLGREMFAELGMGAVVGMGDFAADRIAEAFDQKVTNDQWNIAFEQWGMWAAILIPLVAALMLVQVGLGALTQNKQRMTTAVLGGMFSIPFAAFTVLLMTKVVTAVDEGSQSVVKASIQEGGLGTMFVGMLGLNTKSGVAENSMVQDMLTEVAQSRSINQIFPALLIMLLVVIAAIFLTFAMTFREHGLLILAALAPLALMFIGQGRLVAWAEKWAGLVAGLIMMKPIVVGIMSVTVALGGGEGQTFAELAVSVLVMFLCAFAPFWAVKLADLTGGEFGRAMAERPRVTHKAASVMNSRVAQSLGRMMSKFFRARRA